MEESSSPLYDLGIELMETSSDFLDANKKHPLVEFGKVTLAVLGLRLDLLKSEALSSSSSTGSTIPRFARSHPFVTWLSSFATAYAGSILGCFLTGDSILQPFINPSSLLYATLAFLLVFFSPLDIFARLFSLQPFKIVLSILTEVYRVGNIVGGVKTAAAMPMASSTTSFPAPVLVAMGVTKGSGSSLLLPIIRLLRTGSLAEGWSGSSNEILRPSTFLKASFWASLLVTSFQLGWLPPRVTFTLLHLFLHAFFVLLRLSTILLGGAAVGDPFRMPEAVVGGVLNGVSMQFLASAPEEAAVAGGGGGGEVPAATKEKSKKED